MPNLAEIMRSFVGAWRVARFDLNAVDLFGNSGAAARRSFSVFLLVIPLMLLVNWPPPERVYTTLGLTPLTYVLLIGLQFFITILAFYLLVARLVRRLGVAARFAHYICAQNWLSLPVWCVICIIMQVTRQLQLGDFSSAWLQVFLYAALITYSWVVTVSTLRLKHLPAFALCVLELFFGQFLQQIFAFIMMLTLAQG